MEKKPILFESACLFSFLGSSIGLIYMFLAAFFFSPMQLLIVKFSNLTATKHLTSIYFGILMIACFLSLTGIFYLSKMKRSGLYYYLAAQVIILFLPIIWVGAEALSLTNTLFTLLFSGIYIYYYRQLS